MCLHSGEARNAWTEWVGNMLTAGGVWGVLCLAHGTLPPGATALGLQYCSVAAMHTLPPTSSQSTLESLSV